MFKVQEVDETESQTELCVKFLEAVPAWKAGRIQMAKEGRCRLDRKAHRHPQTGVTCHFKYCMKAVKPTSLITQF